MKATVERAQAGSIARPAVGHLRWSICALLFFAATVNYIDRQVIGILKPTLQGIYGWSEIDYSNIVFAFTTAYAIGLLIAGRLIDWPGVRKGFSVVVAFWSVAAMGHALARSVVGFGAARFALGIGESGSFPSSIKAVAEWFPRKERAFATGIFNAGTNIGAVVAPLVVPFITLTYGWQWPFIATGALGFLWVIAWLFLYTSPQENKRLSPAELKHIQSDPAEAPADSWMGWSYGHWEGETLVVDVTGLNDQTWFDRAGNYHSDALHASSATLRAARTR